MDREYQDDIEEFRMLIGVSSASRQMRRVFLRPRTVITFTKVFQDSRLEECFFGRLRADGIPVELEATALSCQRRMGIIPVIQHDENIWKKLVLVCYGVLAAVACFWAW